MTINNNEMGRNNIGSGRSAIFFFLWGYNMFIIIKMQPMAGAHLNQLEVLSCISVIAGSFSSIFFVMEYEGEKVLTGASRDMAGLFLVLVCSICALISLRIMRKDYSSTRRESI